MNSILIVGFIIFTGFIFGETVQKLKLPKVTGYILAGICLNPRLLPLIPETFIDHTDLFTDIALAFITFSVGGTLLYAHIKKLGKPIFAITILEAECAMLVVIAGFIGASCLFQDSDMLNMAGMVIPISILLGSLASPTDPSATLAVAHEFKANGQVSSTIMGVAAFDDAIGIINYSLGIAAAGFFINHDSLSISGSIMQPVTAIFGGIGIGIAAGIVFNAFTRFMRKETEGAFIVLIFAMLALCFGITRLAGFDELLATMSMGCIVVNFNPRQKTIFRMLERYTEELIFVLFFTLSGMHLNFSTLTESYMLIFLFVLFRTAGKFTGVMLGASVSNANKKTKRYTAFGLIPQGGIVIGLALLIRTNPAFEHISDSVIGIILGATVIHELIGPVLAKTALKKAGEIKG